jgi:hypothetical protein
VCKSALCVGPAVSQGHVRRGVNGLILVGVAVYAEEREDLPCHPAPGLARRVAICVQLVYKKAGLKGLKMDLSNAKSTTDLRQGAADVRLSNLGDGIEIREIGIVGNTSCRDQGDEPNEICAR